MIYAIIRKENNTIIGYMKDESARDYFVNRPTNRDKYDYVPVRYMEEIENKMPKKDPVYAVIYTYTYEEGLVQVSAPTIVDFSTQRVFDLKKTDEEECTRFVITYTGIIDPEELKAKMLSEVI